MGLSNLPDGVTQDMIDRAYGWDRPDPDFDAEIENIIENMKGTEAWFVEAFTEGEIYQTTFAVRVSEMDDAALERFADRMAAQYWKWKAGTFKPVPFLEKVLQLFEDGARWEAERRCETDTMQAPGNGPREDPRY